MAELVYAHALGACGETRGGSNPLPPTRFFTDHEFGEDRPRAAGTIDRIYSICVVLFNQEIRRRLPVLKIFTDKHRSPKGDLNAAVIQW